MQQFYWPVWKILIHMSLLLFFSGCASVDYSLYRQGATEDDFHLEETECRRELGFGGSLIDPNRILTFFITPYQDELQTCLQEKGWKPRL